ncbi:hypothetical protein [Muricoccus aerilatus]|uniref:hypothetical protein n=1 Tax=Muricoccus aerilatus TaxID=452982 RepID=UPI000A9272D2|nr:hypothetical protein [Roseomonas aerilata]
MIDLSTRLASDRIRIVCCIDDENLPKPIEDVSEFARIFLQATDDDLEKIRLRSPVVHQMIMQEDEGDLFARASELERSLTDAVDAGMVNLSTLREIVPQVKSSDVYSVKISDRLISVFSTTQVKFLARSFSQWDDEADAILGEASAENRVLLLIDRTNDFEATDTDGVEVLAGLFQKHAGICEFIDCIILTSKAEPETELSASQEIFEEVRAKLASGSNKARKVFVFSKSRLSADEHEIQSQFVVHFDRLKASRLGRELAAASRSVLESAVADATDWLQEVSLPEFHWSVFRSSEQEGASEIQTLLRLVSLKQGLHLERKFMSDNRIISAVVGLREIPPEHVAHAASPKELEMMRKLEFEREGPHINSLRQPIGCGDVFLISGEDGKSPPREAILLGNPCDMVLRADGKRTATFGLLVPIERSSKDQDKKDNNGKERKDDGRGKLAIVFETGDRPTDTRYVIRPNKMATVPLSVLDLVWMNDDGVARLPAEPDISNSLLSLSQKRAASKFRPNDDRRFPNFEVFGIPLQAKKRDVKLPGGKNTKTLDYSVQRTWRLTEEYAAAALLAFAQTISRPAFGHDFIRGWKVQDEPISSSESAVEVE